MADLTDRLDVELSSIEGEPEALIPRIKLEFRISPSGQRIELDRGFGDVQFSVSGVRKSGPDIKFGMLQDILVNEPTTLEGHVDLDYHALESIENMREGADLNIGTLVTLSGSVQNSEEKETGLFDENIKISSAQWNTVLESISYHDNRIIELDLSVNDPLIRDTLASASASVEQAQRDHDEGDYPGAIHDCRQAVERLRALMDQMDGILDDRKKDDLEDILGKFESGFLGGMAHAEEKTDIEPPLKRDSDFAIGITKSAIRYIGTAFEEEND